ncbi:hypothetical protein JXA63_05035 [Candidatus Woesebacteria bacterium]|nr:hypothetical protein [Candidatus Woesebacteria bacterium]
MLNYFPKTADYLNSIDINQADPIDKKAKELIYDEAAYERASQALRRRFARGADEVEGMDRGEKLTKIKRKGSIGKYHYMLMGEDGSWNEPDERIWVVAMYALWQDSKKR